jgi:hypothetical protein
MPVLVEVVREAEQRSDKSGAALLSLLQEHATCGIPSLQSTLLRLSWHCNQTLFRHLTSWCALRSAAVVLGSVLGIELVLVSVLVLSYAAAVVLSYVLVFAHALVLPSVLCMHLPQLAAASQ